jgi:hypothetical protein
LDSTNLAMRSATSVASARPESDNGGSSGCFSKSLLWTPALLKAHEKLGKGKAPLDSGVGDATGNWYATDLGLHVTSYQHRSLVSHGLATRYNMIQPGTTTACNIM